MKDFFSILREAEENPYEKYGTGSDREAHAAKVEFLKRKILDRTINLSFLKGVDLFDRWAVRSAVLKADYPYKILKKFGADVWDKRRQMETEELYYLIEAIYDLASKNKKQVKENKMTKRGSLRRLFEEVIAEQDNFPLNDEDWHDWVFDTITSGPLNLDQQKGEDEEAAFERNYDFIVQAAAEASGKSPEEVEEWINEDEDAHRIGAISSSMRRTTDEDWDDDDDDDDYGPDETDPDDDVFNEYFNNAHPDGDRTMTQADWAKHKEIYGF
jgi:hypothetical protein